MYDEHSLLVANLIDRYATRPERPGFVRDPDGGATITLAPALPGGVPEANWLPARPAGSGWPAGLLPRPGSRRRLLDPARGDPPVTPARCYRQQAAPAR